MINFNNFISAVKNIFSHKDTGIDKITLSLYGLNITVERKVNINIPHEVTVVVPRVECRKKSKNGEEDIEVIMNSITVVHSPHHTSAGPSTPPPEIPHRRHI